MLVSYVTLVQLSSLFCQTAGGSSAPINREQSLSNPTHKPKQKNACAHTLSHVCNTCKLASRCRHFWVQKFCKYIHMQTHARWAMAEQLMKVLQAKALMWNWEIRMYSGPRSHKHRNNRLGEKRWHTERGRRKEWGIKLKRWKRGGRKRKLYSRDVQSTERMLRWDERANAALSSWSSECNVGLAAEDEEGGGKRTEERRQGERKRKKSRKGGFESSRGRKGSKEKAELSRGWILKFKLIGWTPLTLP